ncbi:DsbA family protein [Deinococcus lacus]|uniref:DsbA family protein n=1 Tax=Deinococcus lacus TaxID=392561 RepID=A0ABW1YB78_9DEIO
MTRPQNNANRLPLIIGTLLAAGLIGAALFAGADNSKKAEADKAAPAEFNLAGQPFTGKEDAPVTMVVVEDFKCPACKGFEDKVFPVLNTKYMETGKVKAYTIIWPFLAEKAKLPEDDSKYAAQASLCMYDQKGNEGFGRYRSVLFRAQGEESKVWATKDTLKELANNVEGLDSAAFAQCLDSDATAARVEANEKQVLAAGVGGTPAIFVNGKRVDATQPAIEKALDQALAAQP